MSAPTIEDIPDIIADRQRFDDVLYTSLADAHAELERRRRDPKLEKEIMEFLGGNILEPLRVQSKAVIARSVMSPNYEVRRFADLVGGRKGLEPLFLEYHLDKFCPNNESKRMIGRLYFMTGTAKNGDVRMDSHNIIDFSESNGERLASVKTLWGQSLVDFHHELFDARYEKLSHTFYDASQWLSAHGASAKEYYRAFLSLFIRHGILFENVMLNDQEIVFTTRVILPAFISVQRQFGLKPLIVQLAPTHTEEDRFWLSYPNIDKLFVAERIQQAS